MKEGSQRFYFGDFTKGGGQSRGQRTEHSRPFQTQPPKEEFDREKLRQKIAAITPEEREARRQQKEAEDKKLKALLLAYKTRPFTDDEWKFLESKPFSPEDIIKSLSLEESVRLGETPKFLRQELQQRATNYIKESLTDRYPSWWEVYDKEGNRVWKMSPADKALLAEMRRFNSLSPEEKYKWYCQLREDSDRYLRLTGQNETAGEKPAQVIAALFAMILALISPVVPEEEKKDQPAQQPA